MSPEPSVPQAVNSVSQVLMSDTVFIEKFFDGQFFQGTDHDTERAYQHCFELRAYPFHF
jgi:hypothetical protein